jgi:hypothetical protein
MSRGKLAGTTEGRTLVNEVPALTKATAIPMIAVIRQSSFDDDSN